ncbi:activated RNA polymerase II transcriptional coactivator p15-like [Symsagittifera roscoffensis]|uniref:activated RNA polymerase II transcriptional coactivator p15-like n=1 Tax=Symsagittifera roscoffensis TaxID=84072 RepID=UPI00307BD247
MPKSKARVSDDNESESGSSSSSDSASTPSDSYTPKAKKTKKQTSSPSAASSASVWNEEGRLALSEKRFVTVKWFKGLVYVDIREYYEKDGVKMPGKKGISLNPEQWAKLKDNLRHIDKKVKAVEER